MVDRQQPLFRLGQVVATPGALSTLEKCGQTAAELLERHVRGDWGELSEEDKQLNNEAVQNGDRILSAYQTSEDARLWIITEADRSSTCLLLPSEY